MTSYYYDIPTDETSAISAIKDVVSKANGVLKAIYINRPNHGKRMTFKEQENEILLSKMFDISMYERISQVVVEQYSDEFTIRLIMKTDANDTNIGADMIDYLSSVLNTIPLLDDLVNLMFDIPPPKPHNSAQDKFLI